MFSTIKKLTIALKCKFSAKSHIGEIARHRSYHLHFQKMLIFCSQIDLTMLWLFPNDFRKSDQYERG